jgi:UDP-N-acetylglucosamine 1-carboxyvinyltransferase
VSAAARWEARNLNYHYRGFARLGAQITSGDDFIISGENFTGNTMYLDFPSHTGTENLMMAASFSKGVSVIENAASDPEIYDFANFLIKMGGRIHGLGSRTLTVEGVPALNPIEHYAMNDRLDAGLFMMAAGIAGGKISIIGVAPGDLRILIEKMMQMGIDIGINGHVLDVASPGRHLNRSTCSPAPTPDSPRIFSRPSWPSRALPTARAISANVFSTSASARWPN